MNNQAMTIAGIRPSRSIWGMRMARFSRHRPAMVAFGFLVLLAIFCFSADLFARVNGIDSNATDLLARYQPPSARHWLGTDELGRDVLLRLMYGGQISILVGLLATAMGAVIGVVIGVVAGYAGGRIDSFLMRGTDCMIALPLVPLLVVLAAVDLTKIGISEQYATSPFISFWRIVIIISLVDWTTIARIARAGALSIKQRDYVLAAKASGARAPYLIGIHVLPNAATPIIVAVTLTVGRVILLESTLSFLGFGILPPTPSWGNMLTNAQELVASAPALAIYPGLLIFSTVIAANFVGDGMRVAFDPRSER